MLNRKTITTWIGLGIVVLLLNGIIPVNSEEGFLVSASALSFAPSIKITQPQLQPQPQPQPQTQVQVPHTYVAPAVESAPSSRLVVVRLQPGTNPEKVAEQARANVIRSGPLNYVTLSLTSEITTQELDTIRQIPGVLGVEKRRLLKTTDTAVTTVTPTPNYQVQWSLNKAEVSKAWELGATGKGIIIAVIDTGIDLNHPDLTDNLVPGYNAITGDEGARATQDDNGHGTHVAGIVAADGRSSATTGVYGVAYQASIMPIKAMESDGQGADDVIADGIVWAVDHKARIINLSVGSNSQGDILRAAIQYAIDKGCLVVAAAGNAEPQTTSDISYPTAGISYPAADSGVMAVTATDSKDQIANFSLTGPQATIAAPGVNIYSDYWMKEGSGYATADGTSMASPFVAGVAALVWGQHPTWTARQVRVALEDSALDLGTEGRDNNYGYGRVDAYWAVRFAATPVQLNSPALISWAGAVVQDNEVPSVANLQVPARAFSLDPAQNVQVSVTTVTAPAEFPNGITPASPAITVQWGTGKLQRMSSLTVNAQTPSDGVNKAAYLYHWSGSRWIQVGGGGTSASLTVGIFEPGIYRVGYTSLPNYTRLAGEDRIETAIQIAQAAFPTGADTVILARADDFPDALAGAPLAYKDHAPILLTDPAQLDPKTLMEIQQLAPQKVILLGGTGAISASIAEQLQGTYQIQRIEGADRYLTAIAIARNLGTIGQAVVVNGQNFPDAISIAAIAARTGIPILLTSASKLDPNTDSVLRQLLVSQTYVVGGVGAIQPTVFVALPAAVRYGGQDRYETAATVLKANPPSGALLYVATGENFPDALTGGVLAAAQGTDIVLVPPGGLTVDELSVLQTWHGLQALALGGSLIVPDSILQAIQVQTH